MVLTKNQSTARQLLCKSWRVQYYAKQEDAAMQQLATRLVLWHEEKRAPPRKALTATGSHRSFISQKKTSSNGVPMQPSPTHHESPGKSRIYMVSPAADDVRMGVQSE